MLDLVVDYTPMSVEKLYKLKADLRATTERVWQLFVQGGGLSSNGKLALLSQLPRGLIASSEEIRPGITVVQGRTRLHPQYILVGPHTNQHLYHREKIRHDSEWPADLFVDQFPLPSITILGLGRHLKRTDAVRRLVRLTDISPLALATQALLDITRYSESTLEVR